MATAGPILKEEVDPRLGLAISKRNTFYSWFRGRVSKDEDINARGHYFTLKTQRNQGYGSLTSAQEGGLMPIPGALARRKVRIDYRDHFISGELTGRTLDAPTKTALLNLSKDAMQDAEESFTTFQDLYMFGNGTGAIGVATTNFVAATITFALAQTTPYGSMMIQPNQRIQFFNPSTFAQRTGGSVTVSTVISKDTSTDIVTFDAVPTDVVIGDIVCIENTINRETQGLDYHVGNNGTTWLLDGETGVAINRAANPWTNAQVIDKAAAALAPDFLDTISLQTSNQDGDATPDWDMVMVSHPCQQNMYRKLGYALQRVVPVEGKQKLDLGFAKVQHNGMEWRTSSHCQADRIYGLTVDDWEFKEVKAPQMYEYAGAGPLIQKWGTAQTYDAAQFAFYARYALVCKAPFNQWLLKNLSFTVADVRRTLN
jgi:hypothetical protein